MDESRPNERRDRCFRVAAKWMLVLGPSLLVASIVAAGFGWGDVLVTALSVFGMSALSAALILYLQSDPPRDGGSGLDNSSREP
jgi:hypothetical protein